MSILWAGESKTLTSAATGGKVVGARYKITEDFIFISSGVLSSNEEQIPMWAVRDCDINQSMVQKARGVSNITITCQHNDFTGKNSVVLESVEGAKDIRDIVNSNSKRARVDYETQQKSQTVSYSGNPTIEVPATQSSAVANPIEQLEKLGNLLEKGLISQEEFDAQKTKLLGL